MTSRRDVEAQPTELVGRVADEVTVDSDRCAHLDAVKNKPAPAAGDSERLAVGPNTTRPHGRVGEEVVLEQRVGDRAGVLKVRQQVTWHTARDAPRRRRRGSRCAARLATRSRAAAHVAAARSIFCCLEPAFRGASLVDVRQHRHEAVRRGSARRAARRRCRRVGVDPATGVALPRPPVHALLEAAPLGAPRWRGGRQRCGCHEPVAAVEVHRRAARRDRLVGHSRPTCRLQACERHSRARGGGGGRGHRRRGRAPGAGTRWQSRFASQGGPARTMAGIFSGGRREPHFRQFCSSAPGLVVTGAQGAKCTVDDRAHDRAIENAQVIQVMYDAKAAKVRSQGSERNRRLKRSPSIVVGTPRRASRLHSSGVVNRS